MGNPSGFARSFSIPAERNPAAAACIVAILQNSLLEITGMGASLSADNLTTAERRLDPTRYSSHPLRRSGRMYFCTKSELFAFRLVRSQLSFCPARTATFPRSSVSVTKPSNSKFPPGFTLLPLHASSHSRSFPGDLGRVFGGCLYPAILASGINLGCD